MGFSLPNCWRRRRSGIANSSSITSEICASRECSGLISGSPIARTSTSSPTSERTSASSQLSCASFDSIYLIYAKGARGQERSQAKIGIPSLHPKIRTTPGISIGLQSARSGRAGWPSRAKGDVQQGRIFHLRIAFCGHMFEGLRYSKTHHFRGIHGGV